MKGNVKGIIFVLGGIALLCAAYYLYTINHAEYSIVSVTAGVISLVFGIRFLLSDRNPEMAYENKVRNIVNTFDSILVKSNSVPKLVGRNIIFVEDMGDLVDAQLEIRKPICYYRQTESCSFVLLDDKEAYVYVEKLNPEVVSPVEIEINDIKRMQKNSQDLDSEMLRDIEKTTIVRLSDKRSYKVSPVRKETKKVEENIEKKSIVNDMEII